MRVKVRITSKDRGFDALLKRLAKENTKARLGVGMHADTFASPHPVHAATYGEIGSANEFGTGTAPPRAFIRQWFDFHFLALAKALKAAAEDVVSGKYVDLTAALRDLGLTLSDDMRQYLLSKPFTPNAPYTVKKKGFDFPLVETGGLVDALRAEVDPSGNKFDRSQQNAKKAY